MYRLLKSIYALYYLFGYHPAAGLPIVPRRSSRPAAPLRCAPAGDLARRDDRFLLLRHFPSAPVQVATAAGLPITRGGAGDALGLAGSDGSGGDGAVGLLLVGLGPPGLGQL